jgi:hypothetical protein
MKNEPDGRPLAGNAPDVLYKDGRFVFGKWKGIPGRANLLDAQRPFSFPLLNLFKSFRLKEWQAIEIGDRDWFVSVVLYNAKALTLASIDLWDKKNHRSYSYQNISLGSRARFGESLYPSDTTFVNKDSSLGIYVHPERGELRLEASCMPPKKTPVMLDLHLTLSEDACLPFSVCLPFTNERALYSTKVLMHCSGKIQAGEASHTFAAPDSLGILDDHKGYYPYRLHYDWVTAFGLLPDKRMAGFNLTDNQVPDQATYNENRLWLGSEIYELPPIKITHPYGHEGTWIIQDTEGLVDLTFYPEAHHNIEINLGLAEVDYAGPFGHFAGFVRSPAGDEVDASRLYGMGEDKNLQI